MKRRDRTELRRYVRACADLLELRDWTVTVDVAVPDSPERRDGLEWAASSWSTPGQKSVLVTFALDVRAWDVERLRQTVAHELIHAHFSPLTEIIREDLRTHLAAPTLDLLDAGFTRHLEFAVDAMADAVAPRLPLIDWSSR